MNLYFIAILPDERIQKEVTAFKHFCRQHFGAEHALNSPPHITLTPPYRWTDEQLPTLVDALDMFALGQSSFEVRLRNFSSFAPKVIYVDVVENEYLSVLQRKLLNKLEHALAYRDQRAKNFHPHLTIAHRDLQRADFYPAWEHFSKQKFYREFTVDQIALLHHHNRKWHIYKAFPFD